MDNNELNEQLNNMEDEFREIKKGIDRCADLLKMAVKSPKMLREMDALKEQNYDNYKQTLSMIDSNKTKLNTELKELMKEKEKKE